MALMILLSSVVLRGQRERHARPLYCFSQALKHPTVLQLPLSGGRLTQVATGVVGSEGDDTAEVSHWKIFAVTCVPPIFMLRRKRTLMRRGLI